MGQQQSQDIGDRPNLRVGGRRGKGLRNRLASFRGSSKFNIHGDDDETMLEEKIKLYRKELERLTAHGAVKQKEQRAELSKMDNELYRKRVELHRLGERAKTHYTFWDYVKIVQRATPTIWSPDTMSFIESESDFSASERSDAGDDLIPVPPSPSGRSKERSKSPKIRRKSKSPRAHRRKLGSPKGTMRKGRRPISGKEEKKQQLKLQRSSTDMTFTIFGFFEAYLLRRLHLALLLKNQSTMQRHRWNDIIVYCYDEIPATKRDTQQAKDWLEYLKGVTPTFEQKLQETLEHLLAVQDKIMYELRSEDERRRGLEEQAAMQRIEGAIDEDYDGTLPTISISQLDSGEIDFTEEDEAKPSSFSYNVNAEAAVTQVPETPGDSKSAEGRIYDASEFNTGTKGAAMERSSHHRPITKSDHNKVFERQHSRESSDDWESSDDGFVVAADDDLGNPKLQMHKKQQKEENVAKKEEGGLYKGQEAINENKGERKARRGSKWRMPWRGQGSAPSSGNASAEPEGDDLKMSAEYSAVGNEYGMLSTRDDDDEDDSRYDYISQEANQQAVASSALAGGASMMMLQKSVRAQQQKQSKPNSQEHFQLSTADSTDA